MGPVFLPSLCKGGGSPREWYFHALDGFASTCTPGASPRLCRFRATEAVTVEPLPYKLFGFLEAFVYTIFFTHIEPVEERRAWLTQEQAGTVFAQATACKEHIEAGVQEVKDWLHAGQAAAAVAAPGAAGGEGEGDMPPPSGRAAPEAQGCASPVTWLSSLTPSSSRPGTAGERGFEDTVSAGDASAADGAPPPSAKDTTSSHHSSNQSSVSGASTDTKASRSGRTRAAAATRSLSPQARGAGGPAAGSTSAPAQPPADAAGWKRPALFVAVPTDSSSSLPTAAVAARSDSFASKDSGGDRRPASTSVLEMRRRGGEGGARGVSFVSPSPSPSSSSSASSAAPPPHARTTSHLQQAARAAGKDGATGVHSGIMASFGTAGADGGAAGRVPSDGSDTSRGIAAETPLHPPTMRGQGSTREPALTPNPLQKHTDASPEVDAEHDPPAPPLVVPQSAIDAFPQFESRGGGVPAFVIRSMVSGRYTNQGLLGAVTYNNAVLHAGVTPWRHCSRLRLMPSGRRVAPPPPAPAADGDAAETNGAGALPAMSADVQFEGGVHGELCSIEELPLGCARDATSGRIFYVGGTDWADGPSERRLMAAGQKILEGRPQRKGGAADAPGGGASSTDASTGSGSHSGGLGGSASSRALGVEDPALGAPSPWMDGNSLADSVGGDSSTGGGLVMPLQLPLVGLPNVVAPAAPAPDIVANPPSRPASSPTGGSGGGAYGSRSVPSWGAPGSAGGEGQGGVMGGWGRQSHGSGGGSGSGRGGGIAILQGPPASAEGGSLNGRFTAGSATGSHPGPHGAFSAELRSWGG